MIPQYFDEMGQEYLLREYGLLCRKHKAEEANLNAIVERINACRAELTKRGIPLTADPDGKS